MTNSLNSVILRLQQHVTELMANIKITENEILAIIKDQKLLTNLGNLNQKEAEETSRFLVAYIFLTQILFLRLFSRTDKDHFSQMKGKITYEWLKSAFKKSLAYNHCPISEFDVLRAIPEGYLQVTFDLIRDLEIERLSYELPGRIFHELMPKTVRKLLAAFYTRPQAADLLARLAISKADATIYDPACGSGTILTSAYRRKLELFRTETNTENFHRQFCEKEIFGSDIMPFAVHLTNANLLSMDPAITIKETHIIQEDSLRLQDAIKQSASKKVNIILMNPPFTKVERGIRQHINMDRFADICGKEIGLWGHFIVLANELLKPEGIFGSVIPISILRGTESQKVRDFIFSNWTPLYIIKSTLNYGFSEWAEYRDILLIAKNKRIPVAHHVKFILIKKDLKSLSKSDILSLVNQIESRDSLRSEEIDIESFPFEEIRKRFMNLMWFCGVCDFKHRDLMVSFIEKLQKSLKTPQSNYFKEGYRPVPKGVSAFMFLTRNSHPSRIKHAFLHFDSDNSTLIHAETFSNGPFQIEKTLLKRTLRTGIGLSTFNLTGKLDYITYVPYKEFERVLDACKFQPPKTKKSRSFSWEKYWENVNTELLNIETKIVTLHRINPYSPNTHLISFYSEESFHPSNVLNVVLENDDNQAKAFCVILNSILFLTQFFLLKEETTGRYINIRFYDFYEMNLIPDKEKTNRLIKIFNEFSNHEFPSFTEQFDEKFLERYKAFWSVQKKEQKTPSILTQPICPSEIRLKFDLSVCKALDIPITKAELLKLYNVLVKEMIITRGLKRD